MGLDSTDEVIPMTRRTAIIVYFGYASVIVLNNSFEIVLNIKHLVGLLTDYARFENIFGIINKPNEILMLKISFHFSFYISLNLSTISFNLK